MRVIPGARTLVHADLLSRFAGVPVTRQSGPGTRYNYTRYGVLSTSTRERGGNISLVTLIKEDKEVDRDPPTKIYRKDVGNRRTRLMRRNTERALL